MGISNAVLAASALQWYLDQGVTDVLDSDPMDSFALTEILEKQRQDKAQAAIQAAKQRSQGGGASSIASAARKASSQAAASAPILGAQEAQKRALEAANSAQDLDALKDAITKFDGLDLKATAANMVFSDGSPKADLMIIGEAPSANDERAARPLAGEDGVLFDRALACINRSRQSDDEHADLYVSNILNWRPPGNRTPSSSELLISLPFIERHIALVKPKALLILGAGASKTLLSRKEGISRLRRMKHSYTTQTEGLEGAISDIPTITSYAPAHLINTPLHKRAFWSDLLALKALLGSEEEGT